MRDFIILLRALLVQEFGHTAKEAERLIGAHPQVVTNAMAAIGESGNTVPNLRPCAMALELADEAIDRHLRNIVELAPTPFKPFPECSNPNPEESNDKWWREMFAAVRANLRAKMVHLDPPPVPPELPKIPLAYASAIRRASCDAISDSVREMCEILMDESADQDEDDKYMALMTLAEILFPDRPTFRDIIDITDASNCPPSSEQVDAAIAAFAAKADAAGDQGASDEPYIAVIVAIEWVLGRESTTDWAPIYVVGIIQEATGYGATATPEKLEEKPEKLEEKPREGHDLLEACKDLLGAMELQQIADEANGNLEAAASCQPFIDKARAAIAKTEGKN